MAGTFSAFPVGWETDSGLRLHPKGGNQDWKLTSTGVGLHYRPPLPFPPPYVRVSISFQALKKNCGRLSGFIRIIVVESIGSVAGFEIRDSWVLREGAK